MRGVDLTEEVKYVGIDLFESWIIRSNLFLMQLIDNFCLLILMYLLKQVMNIQIHSASIRQDTC